MPTPLSQRKQALRRELRQRRRALAPADQRRAADRLVRQLTRRPDYPRVRHVALYWAMDGEIDLAPLMRRLVRDRKRVYLPVLHPQVPRLWFRRWRPRAPLVRNRFGIPEPRRGSRIPPWCLDWVLMPLVGFDEAGGRLGMGGGFYDRTFAAEARWPSRPQRIGVAHECQKVAQVPLEAWDLPLAAVVTDGGHY